MNLLESLMSEIERLYKQLSEITDDCFYQVESDFFMLLYRIPDENKHQIVRVFLTICNWHSTSLRSGVWTFYETANANDLIITLEYLNHTGLTELAEIFAKGIHDYQNPIYAENFDYPDEWIEESDEIDCWISDHEEWLTDWKRNLLIKSKDIILSQQL